MVWGCIKGGGGGGYRQETQADGADEFGDGDYARHDESAQTGKSKDGGRRSNLGGLVVDDSERSGEDVRLWLEIGG